MECESCAWYGYDEEIEDWLCEADVDEDDMARMMQEGRFEKSRCPYWRNGDEYSVVRHQAF